MGVAIGDVFAFTARRRWFPLQVVGKRRVSEWEVVVFDAPSKRRPGPAIVDGAPIYVLRHGHPRNEPLYLVCSGEPPATLARLGRRPVALAFELPTTFRTSPRAGEDSLPVWATWNYARERITLDRAKQPPPFHSRLFPSWKTVDPRALRAIDAAVRRFATVKPATAAALRTAVRACNKHEREIDTLGREELHDKLVAIARRHRFDPDAAAAIIDASRDW